MKIPLSLNMLSYSFYLNKFFFILNWFVNSHTWLSKSLNNKFHDYIILLGIFNKKIRNYTVLFQIWILNLSNGIFFTIRFSLSFACKCLFWLFLQLGMMFNVGIYSWWWLWPCHTRNTSPVLKGPYGNLLSIQASLVLSLPKVGLKTFPFSSLYISE